MSMANRFNFVSPFAAMAGGIREFLTERELQRRQAEADARQAEELKLRQAAEARAAATQEAAAKLQREQFEAGLAKEAVTMAGAGEKLEPGSDAAARIQKYFPSRIEERPAQEAQLPSFGGGFQTEAATAEGVGPVVPGMMQVSPGRQAQEAGAYIRPGSAYEQARASAEERKDIARMTARERAEAREDARQERLDRADDSAQLRRDLQEDAQRHAKEMAELRRTGSLSPASEAVVINRLTTQWDKHKSAEREMQRQYSLMTTGLKRFEADPVGGSQAVLVTFQKILDPTSVVRESEYARSASGLSLLSRMEGYIDRLKVGGAGVPKKDLAAMVETARQFLENTKGSTKGLRTRVGRTADHFGVPRELIFEDTGEEAAGGDATGDGWTTLPSGVRIREKK